MHYYDYNAIAGSSRFAAAIALNENRDREDLQMRYEKGHKEATRQHIIDVASAQFRESGVAAVGLAGVMSAAGLTNGAFYAHFESKEDLVRSVLVNALDRREQRLRVNLETNVGLEATI